MKKSEIIKGAVKYLLGFGLLAFMVYRYWDGLIVLFQREPNVPYMLAVIAIVTACVGMQYYRWYLLVTALGLPFTLRNALRLGLVGTFYNTFLPGSVGGDLVKAYFIAQGHPGRRATAVATVIADRLIGLFGLILYAGAVGGVTWWLGDARIEGNPYLQKVVQICLAIVTGSLLVWAILNVLPNSRMDRFGRRLAGIPKLGSTLAELWFVVRQYQQRQRVVLACVAISAVTHTGFVFMFHLAVRIFPPENLALLGSLAEHFVIAPIGFIGQALFPAPGGVGGGEAIFGYLYEIIRGKEAVPVAVAGRLSLRVCEWILGLIGYIAFLRMKEQIHEAEVAAEESGIPPVPDAETAGNPESSPRPLG